MLKICKKHGETIHSARPEGSGFRCRKCMVEAVNNRRKMLKKMAVEYKGNRCEICGYNKCIDAFDFHHTDSTKKEFGLATGGLTKSWKRIKEEVDKCMLVCANCHREIHSTK